MLLEKEGTHHGWETLASNESREVVRTARLSVVLVVLAWMGVLVAKQEAGGIITIKTVVGAAVGHVGARTGDGHRVAVQAGVIHG